MEDFKSNINFQKLPLVVIDKSFTLKYKNVAFEQINSARVGSKAEKVFSKKILSDFELAMQDSVIKTIEYTDTDGYCAILLLPITSNNFALIFLPSFYSDIIKKSNSELIELICANLTNEKTSEKLARCLARIRKAVYRNFELSSKSFSQCISVSKLVDITMPQLKFCSFSLGVRFNLQGEIEAQSYINANMHALATELLCMFDAVLYLNCGTNIDLSLSMKFDRVRFEFVCDSDASGFDECLCIEKYILDKTSSAEGHKFNATFKDGHAICSLTVPMASKLSLQSIDECSAEAIFRNAFKF